MTTITAEMTGAKYRIAHHDPTMPMCEGLPTIAQILGIVEFTSPMRNIGIVNLSTEQGFMTQVLLSEIPDHWELIQPQPKENQ